MVWGVSQWDVYSFVRCPRILAFKVSGVVLKRSSSSKAVRQKISRKIVGEVGEEALVEALKAHGAVNLEKGELGSSGVPEHDLPTSEFPRGLAFLTERIFDRFRRRVQEDFKRRSGYVLRDLVYSSVEGALDAIEYLRSKYGDPVVFSRGKVVNSLLQSYKYPDFLIGFRNGKYVVVEVKNSKRASIQDAVQVGYYFEASKLIGASILLERRVEDRLELLPVDTDKVVDGVVVYPRLGRIREREKLDISPSMVANILKVYHIAEKGLIPLDCNSSYCSKCRYRSVCESTGRNKLVDLDNVEIRVPLPLVAALEIAEDYDVDLDLLFLGCYFQDLEGRIQSKYLSETASDRLTGLLERSLKISDEEFAGFLEKYTNLSRVDILEALGEIKQFQDIVNKIRWEGEKLNLTFDEALKVAGSERDAVKVMLRAVNQIKKTNAYPSSSLRRVKAAYEQYCKLLFD
ncbi:MAG: hypothetical protein Q6368_001430 [Candidatus Baldrarchaeota archaeon]